MLETVKVLAYISTFSVGVPLLLLIRKRNLKHKYFTLLILLILVSFAADVASIIIILGHLHNSNALLLNVQDIFQFILLLLIYREFYLKERKFVLSAVTVIYLGFEIANSIFNQRLTEHQTWTWAMSSLIFLGLSIDYASYLLRSTPKVEITRFAPAWINMTAFFYFGLSIYMFVGAEYLFADASPSASILFWGFGNFGNIVKNCLFGVAIYCGHEDADLD